MPLSDREIVRFRQLPDSDPDRLRIDPFTEVSPAGAISYGLTSAGYDLRLAPKMLICSNMQGGIIDPKRQDVSNYTEAYGEADGSGVLIPPNSFALGYSCERLRIPRCVIAECLGKSTYARCGIIVNVTPLEPEWEGHVTVEISNTTPRPARVYPLEGILQVLFHVVNGAVGRSYADKKGRYQGQGAQVTLPFVEKR